MSRISRFIAAKELEDSVELDERTIRRPAVQRRLGLHTCRDQTCQKPIRWHRQKAAQALRQRGYHVNFQTTGEES